MVATQAKEARTTIISLTFKSNPTFALGRPPRQMLAVIRINV